MKDMSTKCTGLYAKSLVEEDPEIVSEQKAEKPRRRKRRRHSHQEDKEEREPSPAKPVSPVACKPAETPAASQPSQTHRSAVPQAPKFKPVVAKPFFASPTPKWKVKQPPAPPPKPVVIPAPWWPPPPPVPGKKMPASTGKRLQPKAFSTMHADLGTF